MTSIQLVPQPWAGDERRLGDYLTGLLDSEDPRFDRFRACVAFAKSGALLRLAPSLTAFLERGGQVEILVGIDENITTKQALDLIRRFSSECYVFNNPQSSFHPKVYVFERSNEQAVVFVGSNNLTVGGLYTNCEVSVCLELDLATNGERRFFDGVLEFFRTLRDPLKGNARELSDGLMKQLVDRGYVTDERRRRSTRKGRKTTREPIFPRSPVLPPPSVDSKYLKLLPKVEPFGDQRADSDAVIEGASWKTFVMTLGRRDTQQRAGYSRDIFIPLAARDSDADFWQWPKGFRKTRKSTKGDYLERRLDLLIRPAGGKERLVEDVRLYYYEERKEFRLNCGPLVKGSSPGDLLLIQRLPSGSPYKGRAYELEAHVISKKHSSYDALLKRCENKVPASKKRWGYL